MICYRTQPLLPMRSGQVERRTRPLAYEEMRAIVGERIRALMPEIPAMIVFAAFVIERQHAVGRC